MNKTITDSKLDDATHTVSLVLQNIGAELDDEQKTSLNDTLQSFLSNNCAITVVPDNNDNATQANTITVTKSRRVTCTADETITYEIEQNYWLEALEEDSDNQEAALSALRNEDKAKRIDYSVQVDEIICEHEVDVNED